MEHDEQAVVLFRCLNLGSSKRFIRIGCLRRSRYVVCLVGERRFESMVAITCRLLPRGLYRFLIIPRHAGAWNRMFDLRRQYVLKVLSNPVRNAFSHGDMRDMKSA